jgi:hypothetical protein
MSLKVVIVVLVVITGIFVALLVVGGTQDGTGSAGSERNGIVDRIGDAAGGAATIEPDQVETDCRTADDPALLQFTGSCDLVVHNDGKSLKVLRLVSGQAMTVVAPAPEGDSEVTAKPDPNEETAVGVGEGDTDVSLGCVGFNATCLVRIVT